jgi:hypothetical protein
MAKAVKTVLTGVAIVASVAAVAVTGGASLGITAALLSTIATGAALGAAGASMLIKPPSVPSSQQNRLTAQIDPRAFRKEVFGSTAMATDVRYEEWHGADQDYCSWIICAASHACTSIDEIWLNDELAWTSAGGPQGKFRGYFTVPHLTLEAGAGDNYSFAKGKWNGSHRLTGCCWLHLQFKVTGNSKKAESPFSGGPTSRITIIGKGAPLYDPRRDSTVPGGSGAMRWNDQSTWAWAPDGAEIGENLPLQILRRLIGWRIRNPVTGEMKLATGSGIPVKRIDLQSFIVAANLADEQVARSAGGTEPRYHGAGVVSEGDDTRSIFDTMCAGCCGRFRDTGGKLALWIAHNDLAEAALDDGLVDADVVGSFTFDSDAALEASPNIVRGRYVDPSQASLYQLVDYPEVKVASIDGVDRVFPLDLGMVESASQAQRIASQVLQRKQLPRTFKAPFDERAWRWPVGKVVPLTFAPLGFNRQLFRVAAQDICDEGPNRGACIMELTWEAQEIYAWDGSDRAPVIPARAISYDATKNALVQAIDDVADQAADTAAANAAAIIVRASNASPVSSTSTSISVVAFTAGLTDGTASFNFPAVTINGLQPGTAYLVIFDRSAAAYLTYPEPAVGPEVVDRDNVIIRSFSTANADGTYQPTSPATPGDGGGGYGGRYSNVQQA